MLNKYELWLPLGVFYFLSFVYPYCLMLKCIVLYEVKVINAFSFLKNPWARYHLKQ